MSAPVVVVGVVNVKFEVSRRTKSGKLLTAVAMFAPPPELVVLMVMGVVVGAPPAQVPQSPTHVEQLSPVVHTPSPQPAQEPQSLAQVVHVSLLLQVPSPQ